MQTRQPAFRVGWIGTGVMGASMAKNLLDAGYPLTVTSRTRSKAEPLLAAGAAWADSPAEVAAKSDVVFVMVGYPSEVEAVILGERGVLKGFAQTKGTSRRIVVDMTTSRPSLAVEIERKAKAAGIESLDAPVSGGDLGARNRTLSIMIGGEGATVEAVRPLFEKLGTTIVHQGPAGFGQHAKMTNQILIAGNMAGVCEALLYAQKCGLDMTKTLASVEKGAAGSWSLSNLAPRILRNDFAPGFYVEHFIKDMGIALEEARRVGLKLPILALVEQLYQATAAAGDARSGTQALIRGLAALSESKPFKNKKGSKE